MQVFEVINDAAYDVEDLMHGMNMALATDKVRCTRAAYTRSVGPHTRTGVMYRSSTPGSA